MACVRNLAKFKEEPGQSAQLWLGSLSPIRLQQGLAAEASVALVTGHRIPAEPAADTP